MKLYGPFVAILLIISGWAIFFHFVPPILLVKKIGIQNSYFIAFVFAVICGFSSITATTFYVAIAALANGGANPLLLGLVGGLGLCISDFAFYFVIRKGTTVIDKRWRKISKFIKYWIGRMPDWILYPCIFFYSTLAPIPNDIILVALAIGGTPFEKIAPFLFAGDIASTLILAYLAH